MDPYGIVDNMEASPTTEVTPMDITSDGDVPVTIDPPDTLSSLLGACCHDDAMHEDL
jgi:hypothetical protein